MDPIPAVIGIAVATALITAIGVLWRRQEKSDKAAEARETAAAQREKDCNARNDVLGKEIKATKEQLTEVYRQRAEHAEAKAEANAKLALTCATILRRYGNTPIPEESSGGTSALQRTVHSLLFLVFLILTGCSEERTQGQVQTDAQTDRTESITVSGTVSVPTEAGLLPIPVDLHVERTVTETKSQVARNESRTTKQIDANAIAQQLGGALGKTVEVALAKLTGGLIGGARSSGISGFLGTPEGATTASGLAAAAGLAIQQMLARRRDRQALEDQLARERAEKERQRDDSDKGWDEALRLAKLLPPETAKANP